ncbi:STAS domain-containing protein [Mycobacterium antarcticum]
MTPPSARFYPAVSNSREVQPEPEVGENHGDTHFFDAVGHGRRALNEQRESTDGTSAASGSTCEVTERWIGQVAIIATSGVVDMLTAPQLEQAIHASFAKSPQGIVVDFTDVEFLASAGMGVLVAAHDAAPEGIGLHIVAEGPATSRPLKLVGIADIVPLHSTLDEALAAFSA